MPGSGIFTFHPDDPRPLADLFPKFNDPEVNALLAEAARQRTFGRDVSQLEATANRLRDERFQAFQQNVLSPFIDGLRLGNVTLTAETGARAVARQTVPADGSGRIFVSEAGILGKHPNHPTLKQALQSGQQWGVKYVLHLSAVETGGSVKASAARLGLWSGRWRPMRQR